MGIDRLLEGPHFLSVNRGFFSAAVGQSPKKVPKRAGSLLPWLLGLFFALGMATSGVTLRERFKRLHDAEAERDAS